MNRRDYLRAVIDDYLAAPGSPDRASRADWAIAATLFKSRIPIEQIAHAIRIASLRRHLSSDGSSQSVRSLAYYRTVFQRLSKEECEVAYVGYIEYRYRKLLETLQESPGQRKSALSPPENRVF